MDVRHAHASPSAGDRSEDRREFFAECGLLIERKLHNAASDGFAGECGKDTELFVGAENAEVGMVHVGALDSIGEAESEFAEGVGSRHVNSCVPLIHDETVNEWGTDGLVL